MAAGQGSSRQCQTGLDRLFQGLAKTYRGVRAGIIANPASVDRNFVHAVDRFAASKDFQLTAIFGPQHGAKSDQQDNMIESADEEDPRLGIPVFSLYSEHRKPTPAMLLSLDVLFCDLFDVGVRGYTFLWTMALAMQACAENRKKFVVLDRPNPIGGAQVEGNVLDPEFRSFIGLYPVPMRHGLTAGEMASLLNREFKIGADLDVIEVTGWKRDQWLDQTGLAWMMPSPNMATLDTATVYPGTVLIEGTNLSEGRGTTRPFEFIGAPYLDAYEFTDRLNGAGLKGARFRPVWFRPIFDKHQGKLCAGVQVHVVDRRAFQPYATGLAILKAAHELRPKEFAWRQPPFEYEYKKLPIDILAGSDTIRKQIESGAGIATMEASWQPGLTQFHETRSRYLRY